MPIPFRSHVEQVLDRADTRPDAVVVADAAHALTAAQYGALVRRLARSLAATGLEHGDTIALLATISPEALAVRHAAGLLGCPTVCCPDTGAAGLERFVTATGAAALVVFPQTAAAARALDRAPALLSLGPVAGAHDLLAAAATMDDGPFASRARAGDAAVIVASGGTTGHAKASRRDFATYAHMVAGPAHPERRLLLCTALAYVGQVLADQVLLGGGTVICRPGFEPAAVLAAIASERITDVGVVEPLLAELVDHPDFPRCDRSSLTALIHIGADAPASLRRRLLERAGPVLVHTYGASEAGLLSRLAPPEYDLAHPELLGTAGRPLPGVELWIERPDGSTADTGEEGEIVVRSPAAASGYVLAPEHSSFRPDGFHTGDRGRLDAAGYLHVRGRLADAREVAGRTVLPLDVEEALEAHPDVRYAVALPATDGFGALVRLAPGAGTTAEDLRAGVRDAHLAPVTVVLADRIPVTEQGKPDRGVIAGLLARGAAGSEPATPRG